MPSLVTFAQMRAQARLYADERPGGTDAYLSDIEVDFLNNKNLRFFYDKLVAARGHEYVEEVDASQDLVPGQQDYDLPTDHYETTMVTIAWGGGTASDFEVLRQFQRTEQPELLNFRGWGRGTPKGFRIIRDKLVIAPVPTMAMPMAHVYVPTFTDLEDDADTFDGINGWEKAPTLQTAIEILGLQKKDTSTLEGWLARELERIDQMAADRANSEPKRVRDVMPENVLTRRWPERLPPA